MVTLYKTDFYAWTQRQAELLRQEEFTEVDWHNLVEEIESLGRNLQNELRSRLDLLIMHLLRWQWQPA
jgi:N-acetylglutamate synthase-like GNAT family acetyltransferase